MGYRPSALSTALGAKQSAIGVGRCFHLLVNLVDVSWDTVQNFKLCACRRTFLKSWPFRSSEVGPLTAMLCLVRAGRRTHGSLPRLPSGTFRPPALPPFTCRRETMASAQALRLAHPRLRSADQWPKFASRALGGAARGGRPFKKLFTQQLDVPACEQQPREEGTEGHTLRRAGRGKETEGGEAFLCPARLRSAGQGPSTGRLGARGKRACHEAAPVQ